MTAVPTLVTATGAADLVQAALPFKTTLTVKDNYSFSASTTFSVTVS
ncbi:MAG TPA: hypothetical protein VGP46_11620 [Acidimicrobiales bacterium]|nr:hypothetical protein [Acidimicrobiales bacterium]